MDLENRPRRESWPKDVPIVRVSASASPDIEWKDIEAGGTEFLSEPYYPATLRDVLSRYLGAAWRLNPVRALTASPSEERPASVRSR